MSGFDIFNNMHMSEKPLLTAVGASARHHVGDVWMIDDEGDEGEGEHDEDDEVALTWHQITVTNRYLQQPKKCQTRSCDSCQAPRCPRPLLLLATPPRKATTETKSKAEGEGTRHREAQLGSDSRSRSPRPSHSGSPMSWGACDSSTGTWFTEWGKPPCKICKMGELRGVWLAPVLHSNTWRHSSGGTTSAGHQGSDSREETRQEQHRLAGQEDQLRCPAAFLGKSAEGCSEKKRRSGSRSK